MKFSASFLMAIFAATQLAVSAPLEAGADISAFAQENQGVEHALPYGEGSSGGRGGGSSNSEDGDHHHHHHYHNNDNDNGDDDDKFKCAESLKEATTLYRSWNERIFDHYLTADKPHWDAIVAHGFKQDGVAGRIFKTQVPHSVPLYRVWNGKLGDHFYTTNAGERQHAIASVGYVDDGITGYVYTEPICGAKPLYRTYQARNKIVKAYGHRIYNVPGITHHDHFYTMNLEERNHILNNEGYTDEGIAAYILPAV
ncbi:hypothetical protein HGRIS_010579 [Hohenbuehelia grisea]|uniref:DUF5648 domain-containing protein n=1 Tax=Hohenbuehelia grisea TaxID=104357 RepID=A0ABR3IXV6_9AGAR